MFAHQPSVAAEIVALVPHYDQGGSEMSGYLSIGGRLFASADDVVPSVNIETETSLVE